MDESIDPALVDWELNTSKREADTVAFRAMAYDLLKARRPARVLSLPGATWCWELSLSEAFPSLKFNFTGIERDARIHRKAKKMADAMPARYRMHPVPADFAEFAAGLDGRHRPFDVVFLDWMGTWSREKKADLELLMSKGVLAVGGVLLLTVSLRRGRPETMEELHESSLPFAFWDERGRDRYVNNLKVRGIPAWVTEQAEERFGIKMRPVMASVYYSSTGISNQIQPQLQLMLVREE